MQINFLLCLGVIIGRLLVSILKSYFCMRNLSNSKINSKEGLLKV